MHLILDCLLCLLCVSAVFFVNDIMGPVGTPRGQSPTDTETEEQKEHSRCHPERTTVKAPDSLA